MTRPLHLYASVWFKCYNAIHLQRNRRISAKLWFVALKQTIGSRYSDRVTKRYRGIYPSIALNGQFNLHTEDTSTFYTATKDTDIGRCTNGKQNRYRR